MVWLHELHVVAVVAGAACLHDTMTTPTCNGGISLYDTFQPHACGYMGCLQRGQHMEQVHKGAVGLHDYGYVPCSTAYVS